MTTEKRYELQRMGALLVQALKEVGMSQAELGRQVGMSHAQINNFCRGRRKVGVETAVQLERALKGHLTAESILISQVHDELYDARHGEVAQ